MFAVFTFRPVCGGGGEREIAYVSLFQNVYLQCAFVNDAALAFV